LLKHWLEKIFLKFDMPIITILPNQDFCPDGKMIQAERGATICEALLENNISIEHACEMSCACTTCHVLVRKGLATLSYATETEDDLLDRAWGLEACSRLSCQAILGKEDVEIEIPRYTLNHARENG
jgi:ferredoxin, 2Fe-2S